MTQYRTSHELGVMLLLSSHESLVMSHGSHKGTVRVTSRFHDRVSVPASCGSTVLFLPSTPPLVQTMGVVDPSSSCVVGGIVRALGRLRWVSAWTMRMKCGGSFPDQLSSYSSVGHGVVPVPCTCCMPLPVTKGRDDVKDVELSERREDMGWGFTAISCALIYAVGPGACGLSQ
jgi:hypothetical protein